MKTFIKKYWKHAAAMAVGIVAVAAVAIVAAPHRPAQAAAQAYPTPSIATYGSAQSGGDSAYYVLSLPFSGPFTNDFQIKLCLYNSGNGRNLCFTSPLASQSASGAWTVEGTGEPTLSNTGNWSVWGYPGLANSLVMHLDNGLDSANYQVIPSSNPLPAGTVISNLKLGLMLSEDDRGTLMNTTQFDDKGANCFYGTSDPNADPTSFGAGYVGWNITQSGPIWALYAGNCDNSFDPDVARAYMSADILNANKASPNNIEPTQFVPSTQATNGFDGKPLEVTVQNTGNAPWVSNGSTVIAGSQSGTCDAPGGSEPLATHAPGTSCTVSLSNYSSIFQLKHVPSQFGVGADPASYSQISQQTCTVTGTQSCSASNCTDQVSCESATGYCSTGGCDQTSCGAPVSFGGCDGTWINGCGGTWGNTVQCATTGGDPNVEPGQSVKFMVKSLTPPAGPGLYPEQWQMIDGPGNPFGNMIPINIQVGPVQSVSSVTISCSKATMTTADTSDCTGTVHYSDGTTSNKVSYAVGSGSVGSVTSGGVFSSATTGAGSVIATSLEDSSISSAPFDITVNPVGTPTTGTAIVSSVNSQDGSPVGSSWHAIDGSVDLCDPVYGTRPCTAPTQTFDNLDIGTSVTVLADQGSAGTLYSLRGVEERPSIAKAKGNILNDLFALSKSLFIGTANAESNCSFASPDAGQCAIPISTNDAGFGISTLTPDVNYPTDNFIVAWDPIAAMSIDKATVSNSLSSAGTIDQVNISNTSAAPGSELGWTSSVSYTSGNGWLTVPSGNADPNGIVSGSSETVAIAYNGGLNPGTYQATINISGKSLVDGMILATKSIIVNLTVTPSVGGAGYSCISNACSAVASGAEYATQADCTAACNPPIVTGIKVTCDSYSIAANQTDSCTATVTGTGPIDTGVIWTATGGTVDSSGNFTPSGQGTATVTATSKQDPTKSDSVTITVGPPLCLDASCQATCTSPTLTATPSSILVPESSHLTYGCTNVTSCTLSGGTLDPAANTITLASPGTITGAVTTTPAVDTTYTLNCVNGSYFSDTVNATVKVTVGGTSRCEQNPNGAGCQPTK